MGFLVFFFLLNSRQAYQSLHLSPHFNIYGGIETEGTNLKVSQVYGLQIKSIFALYKTKQVKRLHSTINKN